MKTCWRFVCRLIRIIGGWLSKMVYPKMQGSSPKRISVPKLDGGVNLHDGVTQVEDNQLTDCRNVWWKDGALRTRPGVRFSAGDVEKIPAPYLRSYKLLNSFNNSYEITVSQFAGSGDITSITPIQNIGGSIRYGEASAIVTDRGNCMLVPEANVKINGAVYNKLIFEHNSSNPSVKAQTADINSHWVMLGEEDYYIPTVLVNSRPGDTVMEKDTALNGVLFEGFNLLTPKFKAYYTSNGEHGTYTLPASVTGTAVIRTMSKNEDLSVTAVFEGNADWQVYDSGKVRIMLHRKSRWFGITVINPDGSGAEFPAGVVNNIEVTAQLSDWNKNVTIHNMTFNTWFGGDRSGYGGGTRLFVGGNPEHPNLIHWSDVNNPLYFPENNYAYIGDASTAVTAFGKQGEKLVIFKEHEMYYATHVAGQEYTADDVMQGRIVDVAAIAARFPITPIHATVGCDCPDSVALCDNRLVWAHSDRRVYTLTATNQYSESNVTDLSRNIRKELQAFTADELRGAVAYEYGGHYLLHIGDKAFLFDYEDNSFIYYSYNNIYDQSGGKMKWYKWDFSGLGAKPAGFMDFDGLGYMVMRRSERKPISESGYQYYNYRVTARLDGTRDNALELSGDYASYTVGERPISFMAQTKIFDFGAAERYKDIAQVYAGVEGDYDAEFTWLSDRGEFPDVSITPVRADTGTGAVRRFTPNVRRALRFGVRIAGEGAFALRDMVIKFFVRGGNTRG